MAQDEHDALLQDECPGGTWARQPARAVRDYGAVENGDESIGDEAQLAASDAGIWSSIAALLVSIPALVGSWCWPLLLAGLFGVAASEGAKVLSHTITFGVILAALTNISQYVFHKSKYRTGTHVQRFGPFYLSLLAVLFVMADLTRHVLQDAGIWTAPSSSMYRSHCKSEWRILCLSVVGWLFTIVFTYAGFACLIVSTFWAADFVPKVRRTWSLIRQRR